jgi:hypothetical protein
MRIESEAGGTIFALVFAILPPSLRPTFSSIRITIVALRIASRAPVGKIV